MPQFSPLARFSRIFAMYRYRTQRSRKVSRDCTRGDRAIFDTLGIFERDPRAIAGTPCRLFHCPNGANAFSGRDRLDPASSEYDQLLGKAGGVAGLEDSVCGVSHAHAGCTQVPSEGRAPRKAA
jgi:hypothetical protein